MASTGGHPEPVAIVGIEDRPPDDARRRHHLLSASGDT
jgi:hypothetical protein